MVDRKELLQQYKDRELQAGIFWIKNLASGRVLLGASLDLHGPLNRHRLQLEIGSHPCRALQRDWQELGPEQFEFAIVETVPAGRKPETDPDAELRKLEQRWIAELQPWAERCYNKNEKLRTLTW